MVSVDATNTCFLFRLTNGIFGGIFQNFVVVVVTVLAVVAVVAVVVVVVVAVFCVS